MRAYVRTTGVLFALLTALHLWMAAADWPVRARAPWVVLSTVIAAALTAWAWSVARRVADGRDRG